MKSVLLLALVAMAVLASPAAATNGYAGTCLWMQPIFAGGSFQPLLLGWFTEQPSGVPTTDGHDPLSDVCNAGPAFNGQMRFDLGPIPGAPADFAGVCQDMRAPDASEKRWVITAQIQTNDAHTGGPFGISARILPEYGPGSRSFYFFEGRVSTADCRAYVAAGRNYFAKMNQSNMSWDSSWTQWTMPAPTSSISWDPDANDGEGGEVIAWSANPQMNFTVYVPAAVPEPAGVFAILSGLGGMIALGIRRRK